MTVRITLSNCSQKECGSKTGHLGLTKTLIDHNLKFPLLLEQILFDLAFMSTLYFKDQLIGNFEQ